MSSKSDHILHIAHDGDVINMPVEDIISYKNDCNTTTINTEKKTYVIPDPDFQVHDAMSPPVQRAEISVKSRAQLSAPGFLKKFFKKLFDG